MIRLPLFGSPHDGAVFTLAFLAFMVTTHLTARWWLDPLIRRSQRAKPPIVARYVRKPRYSEIRRRG